MPWAKPTAASSPTAANDVTIQVRRRGRSAASTASVTKSGKSARRNRGSLTSGTTAAGAPRKQTIAGAEEGAPAGFTRGQKTRVRAHAATRSGGGGHTLPLLVPDVWAATNHVSMAVAVELAAISWIRYRYMDTPFLSAAFQIIVGGTLVFIAGILIGSS